MCRLTHMRRSCALVIGVAVLIRSASAGECADATDDRVELLGATQTAEVIVVLDGPDQDGHVSRRAPAISLGDTCGPIVCSRAPVVADELAAAPVDLCMWHASTAATFSLMEAPAAVEVPVSTWLLYDPCADRSCTPEQQKWSKNRVASDLMRANEIYRASFADISLRQRAATSLLNVPAVTEVLDLGCGVEAQKARVEFGHDAGQLNIYYVRNPGARGLWCPPDTILIGYTALSETLAHEVGHALGLEHVPDDEPSTRDNLMRQDGAMSKLTLAQLETLNFSPASIITRAGWRGATSQGASTWQGGCGSVTQQHSTHLKSQSTQGEVR